MHSEYNQVVAQCAKHFTLAVWQHAQVLLVGAILAHGQRTVTAVLRAMGLSNENHFVNYHRVLNRAVWSSPAISQTVLQLLVQVFAPSGTLVLGGDDTIERRRGEQLRAQGIYRDPLRSSHSHFVKASGLRWLTLLLLVPIPFAKRIWALPFLTVLAPSERYDQDKPRAHKTLTDGMRQTLLQVRRWLSERQRVFVADSSYAVIDRLWRLTQLAQPITRVVRFRMDAAVYEPAPARRTGQLGRPRKNGKRLPNLEQVANQSKTVWQRQGVRCGYGETNRLIEIVSSTAVWYHRGQPALPIRWVIVRDPLGKCKTQALLCTDLEAASVQIVAWFIQRWPLEVTHRAVREQLGVETQRQWSDQASARTTPALFGWFSLVTILAHALAQQGNVLARQTAWYTKPLPTVSDALAAVRCELWRCPTFHGSQSNRDMAKLPAAAVNRFADMLGYAT